MVFDIIDVNSVVLPILRCDGGNDSCCYCCCCDFGLVSVVLNMRLYNLFILSQSAIIVSLCLHFLDFLQPTASFVITFESYVSIALK